MREINLLRTSGVVLICMAATAAVSCVVAPSFFIQAFPGHINIIFNAAICFGLVGGIFLIPSTASVSLQKNADIFVGTLLTLIAGLILCQTYFGYLLENHFYDVTSNISEQSLYPEKIINTNALIFLLAGMALLSFPYSKKIMVNDLAQLCTFSIVIIGLTFFIGQMLGLPIPYGWNQHPIISLCCTVSNVIIGVGIWQRWKQSVAEEALHKQHERKRNIIPFIALAFSIITLVGFVRLAFLPNQQLLPISLLATVIGMSLMLYQIMPLLKKIIQSDLLLDQTTTRLSESENRFRSAFDSSAIGMALISLRGRYLKVNQSLIQILGYAEEELLTMNVDEVIFREEIKKNKKMSREIISGKLKRYRAEQRYINKNGEVVWVSVNMSLINNENGKPLYFITEMQNITAEKKNEEQLKHMAYHDTLTGLYNRNKLEQKMGDLLSIARRHDTGFALIFIDLDHFKNVNDTMGHDAGDLLLQVVADRLKNTVRGTDMVARLGGDEFVVVVTDINKVDPIANIVQKIQASLHKPIAIKDQEIYTTMSIGISVYPYDGHDIKTLMKNADLALYRAKEIGRNNYQFCTPEMTTKAQEKMAKQNALVQALAKEEFVLYYQPKLDLIHQRVNGVEALLRWKSAEYGIVSPSEIIHLAEETGLIIPLNEWVLKTACKQVKQWHAEGITPLSVAVNLSPRQFKQANLIESILQTLHEVAFPADSLELEITEGLIMQDPEYVLKVLQELKKQNICIAIDNFGTGYSSLDYLRRFTIDRIKIDKSFIQRVTVDEASASVVTAIIAMAHKLNIPTIAEGVETRGQYEFLLREKCTEVQGFYLSPPLDTEMMTNFLHNPITASYLMKIASEKFPPN